MQRLALTKSVTMSGPNFFGFPGSITFEPSNQSGWYWKTSDATIPISLATANPIASCNCVTLQHGRNRLSIYEHIGALRWMGLDGIVVQSTPLPPYDSRVIDQWHTLCSSAQLVSDHLPWVTGGSACVYHDKVPGGLIQFTPSSSPGLNVEIVIDYPGLGGYELHWNTSESLLPAFYAYSQGYPPWKQTLANLIGWIHRDKVVWANPDADSRHILRLFALHRLADLLGTLSLLTNDHLLAGTVHSLGAGHEADQALIREINRIGLRTL